ncbi:MAG: hypothetical protein ACLGH4_07840 [Actinomycetes bacterium]
MSTAAPSDQTAIPAWLTGLVDDAAIFPPGNSPIPEALRAHREHRTAPYAALVGPFVVSDTRLPDLLDEVSDDVDPLAVSVVVSGGAGSLESAVRWATRSGALDLRSLEIVLRDDDTGAIVHNARRILTAVDQLVAAGELGDEVPVYVEPPRLYGAPPTPGWLGALDEIAATGHRLKFRTGGADADAFPAAHELAASIEAAIDREVAFKCTAGLHNAVRHRDDATGFEHHGFLNVLLATRATLDSTGIDEVAAVLERQDPAEVAAAVREVGEPALESARRWFTSFGSCSVREPLDDLVELDLLPGLTLEDV